jgi:hypothetical protein
MKKRTMKLRLNRETVRQLNAPDLAQAHGQQPTTFPWCRTQTCNFTCNGTCEPAVCFPTTTLYC